MNPPKAIQIGANRYEVRSQELHEPTMLGRLVEKNLEILLEPAQADGSRQDTVLHEVLHAIVFHTGTRNGMGWDDTQEEAVVSAITPLLLDTLQRNPRLIAYLTEKS